MGRDPSLSPRPKLGRGLVIGGRMRGRQGKLSFGVGGLFLIIMMLCGSLGLFLGQGPKAGSNINKEDDDDCHHVSKANYGPDT